MFIDEVTNESSLPRRTHFTCPYPEFSLYYLRTGPKEHRLNLEHLYPISYSVSHYSYYMD